MKKDNFILLISNEEREYENSLNYTFGKQNIKVVNQENANEIVDLINKNYKKVIIFNYYYTFFEMITKFNKSIEVDWIFKYSIPKFSEIYIYNFFEQLIEYKKRNIINKIFLLDYDTYLVFKNKKYFKYLKLTVKEEKIKNKIDYKRKNSIGIIGKDYDETCNFYNALSATTFIENTKIKVENISKVTKKFASDFNLIIEKYDNYLDLISNNDVNLFCNFSNVSIPLVLESFEMGIPCVLGNTSLFDSNKYLKENIVLKSDDDINEITSKINFAIKNKKKIKSEYDNFKKSYVKNSII